jgi:hypothetical protein
MNTCKMLYGEPAEVSNELCSCSEPEEVLHVDIIAALGNALNRIAALEHQYQSLVGALERTEVGAAHAANVASCLANGITPD